WLPLTVTPLGLGAMANLAGHVDRQVFVVKGGSMAPAIPLGSVIFVRPVAPADLQVGDIVSVRLDDGAVLTHRIVELRQSYLGDMVMRTRGDANTGNDIPLIHDSAVIGVVDNYVPYLGYVMAFLSMPSGLVATLGAMGILLLCRWALQDAEKKRLGAARAFRATRPLPS